MRAMIPAVYFDFVGTLVGTYDFRRHLEDAVRATSITEDCVDPEKSILLDKEYTRRVLTDPESALRTARTKEVMEELKRRGFKRVIWTSEDPYTVGEILKREGLQVDRIDATTGYGIPLHTGVDFMYKPFKRKVTKADLLSKTEYKPTIVVDDDPKGLEHCKLSGRSDIDKFVCIVNRPDSVESQKPFKNKQAELRLNVKLFFSQTVESLLEILSYAGR
ncbi:MAG: hypothetical protein QXJ75_00710 [Candidatus Bathyarchaeia archaeon]